MILLLWSCSISWCQNDLHTHISSTGEEVHKDSILVPINAIRIANAKIVELNYEKEINRNLRECIKTDSVLIDALSTNLAACEINTEIKTTELEKQRNIAIITGSTVSIILLILLLIF